MNWFGANWGNLVGLAGLIVSLYTLCLLAEFATSLKGELVGIDDPKPLSNSPKLAQYVVRWPHQKWQN